MVSEYTGSGCCRQLPTSMGEIFSPPRLISSLSRPVSVRKPSGSRKPWSPVWNQPPAGTPYDMHICRSVKKQIAQLRTALDGGSYHTSTEEYEGHVALDLLGHGSGQKENTSTEQKLTQDSPRKVGSGFNLLLLLLQSSLDTTQAHARLAC